LVARGHEIFHDERAADVPYDRTGRHINQQIITRSAVPLVTASRLPRVGFPSGAVSECRKTVDAVTRHDNHAPAMAPITTVGPAPGDISFAAKADAPVTPFACFHGNGYAIDEHLA
jgi:hypothetical protein